MGSYLCRKNAVWRGFQLIIEADERVVKMKRFFKEYEKLGMQGKVMNTYVWLIIVPMLCFFVTVSFMVTGYSKRKIIFSADQSMEQTQKYMGQYMFNVSQTLNTVFWDNTVNTIARADYSNVSLQERYRVVRYIEEYFEKIKGGSNIENIRLFLPKEFALSGNGSVGDFDELKKTAWYDESYNSGNSVLFRRETENKTDYITIGRMIKSEFSSEYVAAIKIYIPAGIFESITDNCVSAVGGMCYIVNSANAVITKSEHMNSEFFLPEQTVQMLRGRNDWTTLNCSGKKTLVQTRSLEYSDWSLVNIITWNTVTADSHRLTVVMVLFLIAILILAYILAFFVSRTVVSRIVRLNNTMILSRNNEFQRLETNAAPDSKDEIDMLTVSYNKLIDRIEEYARIQAENSRAIKNAELKVLQEQINPHFLYNILDLINWLAIKKENDRIVELVRALARFYKIGLHKGKDMMPLSMEIEHVKLYFDMQKIRFCELKELIIDVPEHLMNCEVQKSLFLPLVENSINHGIRDRKNEGTVKISAREENGAIIFTVSDNGCGIPEETLKALKEGTYVGKNGGGFGLKNLNERISLCYGPDFGISYGNLESGAVIYVKIPKIDC